MWKNVKWTIFFCMHIFIQEKYYTKSVLGTALCQTLRYRVEESSQGASLRNSLEYDLLLWKFQG
jgi:hypothetical protein